MHRIDGPGAGVGAYNWTEGNPSMGIPATTVTDDFMNDIQEEVASLIENQGVALVKGGLQLETAINLMIAAGGGAGTNLSQSVPNNQAAPLSITSLLFNKASFKAGSFDFDIFRRTDSSNVKETGVARVVHNPETDLWDLSIVSSFDASGVTLSINSSGQVQMTSDDLAGASYSGTIRVINIKKFPQ